MCPDSDLEETSSHANRETGAGTEANHRETEEDACIITSSEGNPDYKPETVTEDNVCSADVTVEPPQSL